MTTSELAPREAAPAPALTDQVLETVLLDGDLGKLSPRDRLAYYRARCERLQLDPLSRPFEYLRLQGRLVLYATRNCTDQLRRVHGISIEIVARERHEDVYVVTARATTRDGRTDEAIGAVAIAGLSGEALATAYMRAECVPLDTEILTRDGFKRYDQLTVGEEVLAYDCATDRCRWTPLRAITVYPEAVTVRFGTSSLAFRCTPDHSWAIERTPYTRRGAAPRGPYSNRQALRRLVPAYGIKAGQRIVLAAPGEGGDAALNPAEAAILGWVMCDGTIQRRGTYVRLGISQSKPAQIAAIGELLATAGVQAARVVGSPTVRTFPTGRTYACLPQTWFYLSAHDSRRLLAKAGIDGPQDLPRLVTRLSAEARRAMLAAMMAADGTARGVFGKRRKPGVMEAWQILATLEGYALGRLSTSSIAEVPLQRMRQRRHMAGSNVRLTEPLVEPVWCPTTDYGTWVMRQNGVVAITGNTKAKRRVTLSICGLGVPDESELEAIPEAQIDDERTRDDLLAGIQEEVDRTGQPLAALLQKAGVARLEDLPVARLRRLYEWLRKQPAHGG